MAFIRDRDRRPDQNGGTYLGKITKVTGATCYVEIPRLAKGFEYGPAPYPSEYLATEETKPAGGHSHSSPDGGTGGGGDHVHRYRPLAKGDRVAVAFLEGGRDDVVVLVRLA